MEEENKLTINALYKLSNNELMSRFPPFTKIYKYEPFTVSCKIVNPGKGHDYQVLVSADNENWYLVGNFHKGDRDLSALRKTKEPLFATFAHGDYKNIEQNRDYDSFLEDYVIYESMHHDDEYDYNDDPDLKCHVEKHERSVCDIFISTDPHFRPDDDGIKEYDADALLKSYRYRPDDTFPRRTYTKEDQATKMYESNHASFDESFPDDPLLSIPTKSDKPQRSFDSNSQPIKNTTTEQTKQSSEISKDNNVSYEKQKGNNSFRIILIVLILIVVILIIKIC